MHEEGASPVEQPSTRELTSCAPGRAARGCARAHTVEHLPSKEEKEAEVSIAL